MRSSTRRACCASTKFESTCLGLSKAARMALGVISLKVTRKIFFGGVLSLGFGRLFGFCVFLLKSGNARFLLDELGRFRKNHGKMRRNGFSLAVRVTREIDGIGRARGLAKVVYDFAFAGDDLQRGLENLVVIERNRLLGVLLFGLSTFLRALFLLSLLAARGILAGQANADRLFRQVHDVADGRLDGEV